MNINIHIEACVMPPVWCHSLGYCASCWSLLKPLILCDVLTVYASCWKARGHLHRTYSFHKKKGRFYLDRESHPNFVGDFRLLTSKISFSFVQILLFCSWNPILSWSLCVFKSYSSKNLFSNTSLSPTCSNFYLIMNIWFLLWRNY